MTIRRFSQRLKLFLSAFIVILMGVGILWSAAQIDQVREFFSRASGEPANLQVDVLNVVGTTPRPWRHLAQGGEEAAWRIEPIAGQVRALKPEYIRIDHIYDFYEIVQGTPGNLQFDFSKFDVILNDIEATGATPYIALSYMPPAISSGDIVATPQNWADWQLTVQKTIEHVSGTRNTPNVYYEVWNEPDLFGGYKYYGDKNYLTMYTYAAQGAQNARVRQNFKIGGPAITALYKNWFDALLTHAARNNLRLDFFSWHRYSYSIDQYRQDMTEARTWLQRYPGYENIELHITEWGHDSNNHAGYDTRFGAAHTVAGAIEMMGIVDKAFVFEIQDGKDPEGKPAWGRWGMLQHQSFGSTPKPRYRALQMIDRLGNLQLQVLGKGTWVKAAAALNNEGHPQVIIANYDQNGRNTENVPLTFTNIIPGEYTITKEFLSGLKQSEKVATTSTSVQTFVPMAVNDVALVTLTPVIPTQ